MSLSVDELFFGFFLYPKMKITSPFPITPHKNIMLNAVMSSHSLTVKGPNAIALVVLAHSIFAIPSLVLFCIIDYITLHFQIFWLFDSNFIFIFTLKNRASDINSE